MRPQTLAGFRLYRFYDERGALLYVGQTGRMPLHRAVEHLREQSWAGEVATWQLDPRVWGSVDEVLDAERRAIRAEQPRYNVVHNGRNPHRVPVARTPRQRGAAYRPPSAPVWPVLVPPLALFLAVAVGVGWMGLSGGAHLKGSAVAGVVAGVVAVWKLLTRRRGRRRR